MESEAWLWLSSLLCCQWAGTHNKVCCKVSEVVHSCHADLAVCRAACTCRAVGQAPLFHPQGLEDMGLCRGSKGGGEGGGCLSQIVPWSEFYKMNASVRWKQVPYVAYLSKLKTNMLETSASILSKWINRWYWNKGTSLSWASSLFSISRIREMNRKITFLRIHLQLQLFLSWSHTTT